MSAPRPARFLLDMDGTLVNSIAVVERTWTDFADEHGLNAAEVIAFAHGRPTIDTVVRFLPDHPDPEGFTDALIAHEAEQTEGIVEIPGAAAFVGQLGDDEWALVTSAPRDLALQRLRQVGITPPRVTVCTDDITIGKPDPEPYLMAAERLGVAASDCVALEDSEAGARSAMASGATTIVVGRLDLFDGTLRRVPDLTGLTPDDLRP